MKLINYIQEKCKKRNKLFLSLDVIFNILTLFFALRLLYVTIPSFLEPSQSVDSIPLLLACMTLSLGLIYLVRVIEMLVTRKRNYFVLSLSVAIFALTIATVEFYWLLDK